MNFERTITRYGHSSGYTIVCFTGEDETFISAGNDGDIHIWKGIEDDDPSTGCTGEFIASVAFHDSRVFVGTDLNTVQILTFPDLDRDGSQCRFTARATAIKANDQYVASGSEDTNIKVYDNETSSIVDLVGHKGPILGLDLTSTGLLASTSGDGTVKVWDIKEQKVIHSFDGIYKATSFELADRYVSPSFSPKGYKYLAYPKEKEVIVVETSAWNVSKTLKDDKLAGIITVCAFSRCGRFLAVGTTKGEICIWKFEDSALIKGMTEGDTNDPITSLDWNPNGLAQLVFADRSGQIGCINVLAGKSVKPAGVTDVEEDMDLNLLIDDDDEDNENCVSLERLKNDTMKLNGFDYEGNSLNADDIDLKSDKDDAQPKSTTTGFKMCAQQPAFQSSSSPSHLEHRYLVWNEIGIVRAHKTDTENSIEAEFHDASMHHGIHVSNFLSHTMASLSSSVLALAGGDQNKLVCIALGAGSLEWSAVLPNCEDILAVAASEKLVVVATDTRFLRVFSFMGNQREIVSLPGPVVGLASYKNKILAVYHSGISVDDQKLSCLFLEAMGLSLKSREVPVPLTPRSKLAWIGFTDRGTPVTYDSFGMVRILKGNIWIPVCDTTLHTKGASDSFFLTDVSEYKQIVRAVLCRGTSFPMTNPRPTQMELPMKMPLCEVETDKSQWEDELIRYNNFDVEDGEKHVQEVALKLFALACRSEIEMRARDLIETIGSSALIPLAAKYANKLGRIHLAEKLSEMMPRIMEMEQEKESAHSEEVELFTDSQVQSQIHTPRVAVITTPIIAPKLIKTNSGKRNPFKKSGCQTTPRSSMNPIKHLTDEIIGLPTNRDFKEPDKVDEEKTKTSVTNVKSPTRKTFIEWYSENKVELMSEMPEGATPSELTSYAMKKFKRTNQGPDVVVPTNKRKLDEKENEESSGIAKLAKFKLGV